MRGYSGLELDFSMNSRFGAGELYPFEENID
jgi:hypothetical protein